uniref:Uncharacterized protein n=1 Tax=Kwoniella dejecticola CBS 10117 TaxID=1296121 RepID=A0A1A6AAH7_9TREE|nr:uncharacterized protein I303_03077 [Kwoniella dejecticola CBS 10117]OBR87054.1 hypothetical protein I303_03077 [Kwoniella dejecticola CBS 10117]
MISASLSYSASSTPSASSSSSSTSSASSAPTTPGTTLKSQSSQLDSAALATLIRQLKRSPESPSRLTLPPIMGVLTEEDEEDEEEAEQETHVVVEEVDSSPNTEMDGLYDIPEEDEEALAQQEREVSVKGAGIDRVLWVIDEEGSENHHQPAYETEVMPDDCFGEAFENVPPVSPEVGHSTTDIDRYSPPPPSPSMHHTLSPKLPDSPSVPEQCFPAHTDENSAQQAGSNPSNTQVEEPVSAVEADDTTDQFANSLCEAYPSVTPYIVPLVLPARRRRRTLSELEQYRKFAMNKAAIQSWHEAAALEQQRRSREAQSFPPSNLHVATQDYTNYYDDTTDQADQLPTDWYEYEEENGDLEIRHVEYASTSSPSSSPTIDIPISSDGYSDFDDFQHRDEDEIYSPLSDQLYTPALSDYGGEPRRFFPSATDILAPIREYTSVSAASPGLDHEIEEVQRMSIPEPGQCQVYGLGLGLTGMNHSPASEPAIEPIPDGNGRMSFDQMINLEEGKELGEDEISLVEMPIQAIFPERTFEEFKAAGREYTRQHREDRNRAMEMDRQRQSEDGRNRGSTRADGESDNDNASHRGRSSYREDLDGLPISMPIAERGRSRTRNRTIESELSKSRSTESYLTYIPLNSMDSYSSNRGPNQSSLDFDASFDGYDSKSSDYIPAHMLPDPGIKNGPASAFSDVNAKVLRSESLESIYSKTSSTSASASIRGAHGREILKRRHSAPGILDYRSTYLPLDSETSDTEGDSESGIKGEYGIMTREEGRMGRIRSKSDSDLPSA